MLWDVDIDDLAVFGPIEARRRKLRGKGLAFALTVEQWRYPDGFLLRELSTRCPADDVNWHADS